MMKLDFTRLIAWCEIAKSGVRLVVRSRRFNPHATKTTVACFVRRGIVNGVLATQFLRDLAVSVLESGKTRRFVDPPAGHFRELRESYFAFIQRTQTLTQVVDTNLIETY